MAWDSIQASGTVIDFDEFNKMGKVIRHSSSEYTKFNSWWDGAGNRFFKVEMSGDNTNIRGGDATTNDMYIFPNDATYPNIYLDGDNARVDVHIGAASSFRIYEETDEVFRFWEAGGENIIQGVKNNHTRIQSPQYIRMWCGDTSGIFDFYDGGGESVIKVYQAGDDFELRSRNNIIFRSGGTVMNSFSRGVGLSRIKGGSTTGDDLYIYPNSVDSYPQLVMGGNATTYFAIPAGQDFRIYETGSPMFRFDLPGTVSRIQGGTATGYELQIKATVADSYPYIKMTGSGNILLSGSKVSISSNLHAHSISTQTISGQLLALHRARDILNWDSSRFTNSGILWNGANWIPMPSGGTGGSSTFTGLTDTPSSFVGSGGRFAVVNGGETAIVFRDIVCTSTEVVVVSGQVVLA